MIICFHRSSIHTAQLSKCEKLTRPRRCWVSILSSRSSLKASSNEQGFGVGKETRKKLDCSSLDSDSVTPNTKEAEKLNSTNTRTDPALPFLVFLKKMISRALTGLSVVLLVYMINGELQWMRFLAAVVFPALIGIYSLKKGSLSSSGALAAWFVGFGPFLGGLRSVAILLSFFFSSTMLTKFKDKTKATINADHKTGGQRDWIQVFSNGFFAAIFSLIYAYSSGFQDSPLVSKNLSPLTLFTFGCVLGNYACTCGDTWASELGVLAKTPPRLITTLQPVHRGTNGGVTMLGLLASLSGGFFVGFACFLTTVLMSIGQTNAQVAEIVWTEWPVMVLGMIGGLFGSVLDSILGATLQFSGFDKRLKKVVNQPGPEPKYISKISGLNFLSNNQVNLISSFIMALLVGQMTLMIFG